MIFNPLSAMTAFVAGLGSFFAPCVIPLLPAYISYVTGISSKKSSAKLSINILLYVLGFSVVFTLLGAAAGGIGSLLREYTRVIQIVGGLAMIIFGLQLLEIIKIKYLYIEKKIDLPNWAVHTDYLRSFLIGVLFAVSWTPCVGPIIGGILSLAAASSTSLQGGALLFIYSLGITLPFILVSLSMSFAPRYLRVYKKYLVHITKISGLVLVIFGVLLLTDTYKFVNALFLGIK